MVMFSSWDGTVMKIVTHFASKFLREDFLKFETFPLIRALHCFPDNFDVLLRYLPGNFWAHSRREFLLHDVELGIDFSFDLLLGSLRKNLQWSLLLFFSRRRYNLLVENS